MLTLQNYVRNVQRNLCRSSLSSALLQMANLQRAHDTCAHTPSDAPAPPIGLANYLSASRPLPLPAQLRLPAHPFRGIDNFIFVFPETQTTTTETEQYPSILKIDPPAKV